MNNSLKILCVVTLTFLVPIDTVAMQAQATTIQRYAELARQNPGKMVLGLTALVAGAWFINRTISGSTPIVPPTTPSKAPSATPAAVTPKEQVSAAVKPTDPSSAFSASTASSSSSSTSASSSSINSGATMQTPRPGSAVAGTAVSAPAIAHAKTSPTTSSLSSASVDSKAVMPKIDFLNPTLSFSAICLTQQSVNIDDIRQQLCDHGFNIPPSSLRAGTKFTVLHALTDFEDRFERYCQTLSASEQKAFIAKKPDFMHCIFPAPSSADDIKEILSLITIYGSDYANIKDCILIAETNVWIAQERSKAQPDASFIARCETHIKTPQNALAQALPGLKAQYDSIALHQ